jgi:Uma2 family endonuclease
MRLANCNYFLEERVELIGGEIIKFPRISPRAAACLTLTLRVFLEAFDSGCAVRSRSQLDFGRWNQPEPDIAVVQGSPRDFTRHPTAALLALEAGDSSLKMDLGLKSRLYAKYAVSDYWVVNLLDNNLIVHRRPEPDPNRPGKFHYAAVTVVPADGTVSPLARPEARIAVADLLP